MILSREVQNDPEVVIGKAYKVIDWGQIRFAKVRNGVKTSTFSGSMVTTIIKVYFLA